MTNLPAEGGLLFPRAPRLRLANDAIDPHSLRPQTTDGGGTGSVAPGSARAECCGNAAVARRDPGAIQPPGAGIPSIRGTEPAPRGGEETLPRGGGEAAEVSARPLG